MIDQTERLSERTIPDSVFRKSILWYDPPFSRVEDGGLVTCVGYLFKGNHLTDLQLAARYLRPTPPIPGSYALYYQEQKLLHVGRVLENGLVISKWGWGGDVRIHPIDGVPLKYGDEVHFRVKTVRGQLLLTMFKHLRTFREAFTYPQSYKYK